jgi:DNA-binding HxlR family transcriptional regulator
MERPSLPAPRTRGVAPIPRPAQIFDPVARALDVIGDRWTLVLVRQLFGGPQGFQALRVRTGIAPRVLSQRLRQLVAQGFVEPVAEGSRSAYAVTDRGRSLEPIVSSIARWYVHHAVADLGLDTQKFTETSAQAIMEALPSLLREDRALGVDVTFEVRLTGAGGGVWGVRIHDGRCEVTSGFVEGADVRYTAEARDWCAVALGYVDGRDAVRSGSLVKEGGQAAMDHFFHQVARLSEASRGDAGTRTEERSAS